MNIRIYEGIRRAPPSQEDKSQLNSSSRDLVEVAPSMLFPLDLSSTETDRKHRTGGVTTEIVT